MSDKTTSDQLKHFFAQNGGGEEKDWKRTSKKKNGEGQWVRTFENRDTGVQLEVVETGPGQFKARRLTAEANPAFSDEIVKKPVFETDPAKKEAADKVIEQLMEDGAESVSAAQLKKAGRALANRFHFSVGGKPDGGLMDGLFAEFSPPGDYDQHLEHVIGPLLPKNNGGEVMELTFDFSAYKDPVKLVSDLQKCGFVWDAGYQAQMDAGNGCNHLPELQKVFGAAPAAPAPQCKPPTL
jgi:hypothetical protein